MTDYGEDVHNKVTGHEKSMCFVQEIAIRLDLYLPTTIRRFTVLQSRTFRVVFEN